MIIGNPETDKTPALFRAFGQFVESLGGRFYTGTDMGTYPEDFVEASKETVYITGLPETCGGGGDSSVPTAAGVIYGLRATNKMLFGKEDLAGVICAVQGLGKVGSKVAEKLLEEGARLIVADINEKRLKEFMKKAEKIQGDVTVVSGEEIFAQKADIFIPCAAGGVINEKTINQLRVKAIAGSANNQLLYDGLAGQLKEQGILYAPDYIINAGGLISVADELYGFNKERVLEKTKQIYDTLLEIFETSRENNITTLEAANIMCEKRITLARKRNNFFTRGKKPKWDLKK
mgnify:CR=1 FL=1